MSVREAILTRQDFAKEIVDVDGQNVEVRQPSLRIRSDVNRRAASVRKDGSFDIDVLAMGLWLVIECCYDVETGEKVFSEADYDELAGLPSGGIIDNLIGVASQLSNLDVESKKNK